MTVSIVGIGTWLPDEVRGNDAWPEGFGVKEKPVGDRVLNDIQTSEDPVSAAILERHLLAEATDPFLGTGRRHIAPESISAAEAEAAACQKALKDAGLAPQDVDLLLTHSLVVDRPGPFTAPSVAKHVGITNALALTVDSVCSSGVTQLQVAQAYLESGLARVVLIAQSHLVLRAVPLMHPATPGLGDAAAAMVLTKSEKGLQILSVTATTHGEHDLSVVWMREEANIPWYREGGSFRVGSLNPPGAAYLMRETVYFGSKTITEAAQKAGVSVHDLSVIAAVQPRGFMPGAIAERLGLSSDCAVTTYDETAHIGACGTTLNLEKARSLGKLTPGSYIALYGQGAGFTRAAAILKANP